MGNMCLLCVGYGPTMGGAVYFHSKTNISQLLWPLLVTAAAGLKRCWWIIWWHYRLFRNHRGSWIEVSSHFSPCKIWRTHFFLHSMFTKVVGLCCQELLDVTLLCSSTFSPPMSFWSVCVTNDCPPLPLQQNWKWCLSKLYPKPTQSTA